MNRIHYIYIIPLLLLIGAAAPLHAQTIKGTIYGGGQLATVDGNTEVTLNTGEVHKDVFGGGKGKLNDDNTVNMSADVTGNTTVTANGTTFVFPEDGYDENAENVNHNVYGGGNLACVIGTRDGGGNLVAETGNTNVNINAGLMAARFMDGNAESVWGKWIGDVNTRLATQHDNYVQGSVFGGGYGVNTSILGTAKVHVNVAEEKTNKAMVDVVGGGYNGYVLNNTDVTVQGVPEIYKIYGGGLGSHGGYTNAPTTPRSHANLHDSEGNQYTMQATIGSVGENKPGDGTSLLIKGGKFYNDIFGGGAGLKYVGETNFLNVAEVFGKTNVVIDAIAGWMDKEHAFQHKIYGGGALGLVNDEILVEVKSGTMTGAEIFAGSLGEKGHLDKAKVTASATVRTCANGSTPAGVLQGYFNIYGGCDMAQMEGDTHVELQHGTFSGNIFGGGKGLPSEEISPGVWEEYMDYGKVTGNTSIVIDEPSLILGEQAGFDANGNIVNDNKVIRIYGGGALGLVDGIINPVTLRSGTIYGEVFGGSLGEEGHPDKAKVIIAEKNTYLGVITEPSEENKVGDESAALTGIIDIYGACDMAQYLGNAQVKIKHGDFSGRIFGGGKGLKTKLEGDPAEDVNRNYGKVVGTSLVEYDSDGTFTGSIYGGGALGKVDGLANVIINNGTIYGDIYGASYGETTHPQKGISGSTLVEILGGTTTGDVYGGGALASVAGNTEVHLYGGSIDGDVYGGGLGDDATYEEVGGNATVILGVEEGRTNAVRTSATEVKGSIFGANNVNGTPRGLAKVHVWTTKEQTAPTTSSYHIKAIYGGGNQSAYRPQKDDGNGNMVDDTETSATVIVEFCDNSIQDVYGGGNAAPVSGTDVIIFGGTIDRVFAGGNGLGTSTTPGNPGYNPGADVGWLNFYSDGHTDADVYGSGLAQATIYGGTINQVFGGSNTLGYIRGSSKVAVENEGSDYGCPLKVGEVFGAGNQAPMDCDIDICLNCSDGANVIYAGANKADVNGNITLTIASGTYNKVFGGNNESGNIRGSITVNVDEYGCKPVIIRELYASSYQAPYSIYGYDNEGNPRTSLDGLTPDGEGKYYDEKGKELPYDDPEINIISCTAIGSVFGGGYEAEVVGNPVVNVNMIKGAFADYTGDVLVSEYNHNGDGKEDIYFKEGVHIPDAIGAIGIIYGGGNMAAVHGDTKVNICTLGGIKHIQAIVKDAVEQPNPELAPDANITPTVTGLTYESGKEVKGNVYGGGRMGNVFGDTKVHIKNGTVEGDVYGAGQGEQGEDKALVTGKTEVIIGEEL